MQAFFCEKSPMQNISVGKIRFFRIFCSVKYKKIRAFKETEKLFSKKPKKFFEITPFFRTAFRIL